MEPQSVKSAHPNSALGVPGRPVGGRLFDERACAVAFYAVAFLLGAAPALGGMPGPEDDVLIRVNGEPVLKSTVDKIVEPMTRARLSREELVRFRREAVRSLVTDMLIGQFLKKQGYSPGREEIDAEIARLRRVYERSRRPGAPSFEESLRRRGAGVAQMKGNPTARMRFSCYVRGLATERDLKRLFQTERHAFDGTRVRASHVLVDTRKLTTPEERSAARKKAEGVAKRAKSGEDFAALARETSECPSAAKGGDLGLFPRLGTTVHPFGEEFTVAAFLLDTGEVSEVVETAFGFHVIRTTEVERGREVAFEDVREEVEAAWAERRGHELFEEIMRTAEVTRPGRHGGKATTDEHR